MKALQFEYVNHKGENHTYKVIPITVGFTENKLYPSHSVGGTSWNLSCFVLDRDMKPRNGVRVFAILRMKNVGEVEL